MMFPTKLQLFLLGTALSSATAFTLLPSTPPSTTSTTSTQLQATSRRDVLNTLLVTAATTTTTPLLMFSRVAHAAAAEPPQEAAPLADKMTVEYAKNRFQLARNDLKYLITNYSEISQKGGGDAVRNYLGTQGVNRNMFGIQKVLKALREDADDIVEFTETMDEFNAYYYQAEGAAYQSMFAEHSSAKATPESLLATAKKDLLQVSKYMDELAAQLNL